MPARPSALCVPGLPRLPRWVFPPNVAKRKIRYCVQPPALRMPWQINGRSTAAAFRYPRRVVQVLSRTTHARRDCSRQAGSLDGWCKAIAMPVSHVADVVSTSWIALGSLKQPNRGPLACSQLETHPHNGPLRGYKCSSSHLGIMPILLALLWVTPCAKAHDMPSRLPLLTGD